MIERESPGGAHPDFQYSAGEPKKHDIQREEWDRWVRGKGRSKFPLFEKLKEGEWSWVSGSEVEEAAPWALGVEKTLGSSETYHRFVREDSATVPGAILPFERDFRHGELYVRYSRDFVNQVLNALHEFQPFVPEEPVRGRRR